jgi:N-acetylmuramic acid 6-phosphate (MurNAc-6-P) etherase
VSGNRMSNLQARNIKLRERAVRIVSAETGLDDDAAKKALEASNWSVSKVIHDFSTS